jgi:3-(3-hydroxy-phenyl)propionate hydroxylase
LRDSSAIIAGAGPVGLSLALALARRGVRVDVLEAQPELSREARASTLHPRTLEMFAELGVIDPILARGARVDRLQYWERETRSLVAEFPYSLIDGDTPYPFRFQCPQHTVTPVLRDALERTGLGRVHFDHRVVGLAQHPDRVEVFADTSRGRRELSAGALCGADGARSAVRECLDLQLDGRTYADRFLLVGSDIDYSRHFPRLGPVGYIFDPVEWVIVMRLPTLVRTVFRLRPDEDADAALGDEAIRARIAGFIGERVDFDIRMRAIYSVHQRVVERFRVGNVILLGDAAHVNNPAGGMGMNSGIHDAYHLAAPLADMLRRGDDDAVAGWAAARRAVAVRGVQSSSDVNYRRMTVSDRGARSARNDELARLASDPAAAREFLLDASMLEARA